MDVALLGWIGTCCSALAMLPQCITILRSRSCEGASPLTLAIYGTGALAWMVYGFNTHDVPLTVSSILALAPTGVTLVYVLHVTRRQITALRFDRALPARVPEAVHSPLL